MKSSEGLPQCSTRHEADEVGCYFEAYLDGLTRERVQVELVVISLFYKFVKNRGSDPLHILRSRLQRKKK